MGQSQLDFPGLGQSPPKDWAWSMENRNAFPGSSRDRQRVRDLARAMAPVESDSGGWFRVVLVAGMLITGSVNTVSKKMGYVVHS